MKHLPKFRQIPKHTLFFPSVLILISLLICTFNYTPGTYLSGWDTLHPEFDLKLNFIRTFFGVFRTEQGLGALAAHAHMVELPRIALLGFFDIFLPTNFIRYAYIFLCLILGPVGMYYFLVKVVIKKRLPSFLGALFYLLNLGTYQTFIVPFEMFVTLYATLPYLFWSTSQLLVDWRKKNILFFAASTIFLSIAAYASTLWYVAFIAYLLYFTPLIILKRKIIGGIVKRYIALVIILLLLNSYWLFPNVYFALTSGTTIPDANINKLFSEDAFLKNKEFGTWDNILLLKSFYFDWGIFNYKTQGFEELTLVFQNYLKIPIITALGYIFGIFWVGGFLYSIKKYRIYSTSFILVTLFSLIFLVNDNPPFSPLFSFMQQHLPLFKEALRFPDNKIQVFFVFFVAIYFALFNEFLLGLLSKLNKEQLLRPTFTLLITLSLIFYMLPIFKGNLIQPYMRINIPKEYFEMFDRLKNENGRIANFPVHSPWGWTYYNWWKENAPSFQGAGFLYFGFSPSLLERDFDRWNPNNEQYYREISHALYANDITQIKEVITKYNISYLLFDTSVINPGGEEKSLHHENTKQLFEQLSFENFIKKDSNFGSLTLYKVTNPTPKISTLSSAINSNKYEGAYYSDTIFNQYGNYISKERNNSLFFPFGKLIDNESKINKNLLTINSDTITLNLPNLNYSLTKNTFTPNTLPANVIVTKDTNEKSLSVALYPISPIFNDLTLVSPIKVNFPYDNNSLLSVNEKVFKLEDVIENNPSAVGNTFLSPQENIVALFDMSEEKTNYDIASLPFSFSYCDSDEGDIISIFKPSSLNAKYNNNKSLCLHLPLNFNQSSNELDLFTLQFTSNTSKSISACLGAYDTNSCKLPIAIERNGQLSLVRFALLPQNLQGSQLILRFEPQPASEISLENFSLNSLSAALESKITSEFLTPTLPTVFQTVILPYSVDSTYYYKPNSEAQLTNDCKSSTVETSKTVVNSDVPFFLYKSNRGTFCDHISFEDLPHSLSYLLIVKSRHKTGLPMNICLTNYTSRKCDLYARLSKNQTATDDIFFIPSSDSEGKGYDVNIENTGIKGTPAQNELYSLTFIPIPHELLSQIQTGTAEKDLYDGKITSATSLNPSTFLLKLSGKKALVTLSENYHKGFAMYEITCSDTLSCRIKTLLSPLLGKKVNKHYEANSWKNSWEVSVNSDSSYSIVFLPQYLEYFGFMLVLILVSIFILSPAHPVILRSLTTSNKYFEEKSQNMKKKVSLLLAN